MLRLKLTNKIIGQYLAKPIFDKDGRLLVSEETIITEPIAKNLREKNILYVYIDIFKDLKYDDSLFPDNQKILLLKSIEELHTRIKVFIPIYQELKERDAIYLHSDAITREIFKIVSPLIDTVFYMNDTALSSFIEYRFMFPFYIQKILINLIYGSYFAKALKLNNSDIEKLATAFILMDIGFYTLPDKFMSSNYFYAVEDYEKIQNHPLVSFDILRNIIGFDTITASLVYMSHERLDGAGYPRKLKREEIPLLAQILGIVDTFTELKYSPKYKNMLHPELIYNLLASNKFEKKLSEIFAAAVPPYPIGTTVFLNNGELAVVIGFDKNHPFNPTVRKIDAENLYDNIIEYNLINHASLSITGYVW